MSGFFEEVQRRKVYRIAAAYIIAAGFIIQIGSAVFPAWELPGWAFRLVVVLGRISDRVDLGMGHSAGRALAELFFGAPVATTICSVPVRDSHTSGIHRSDRGVGESSSTSDCPFVSSASFVVTSLCRIDSPTAAAHLS
jgi:hypothetical protein